MNKEHLKSLLQRDKTVLKELYLSNSKSKSKNILTFASDSELNTLMKYLHFVSNGVIPIKKHNFEAVEPKYLSAVKKHFEKKASLQNNLNSNRKNKLSVVIKLIPSFNHLLAPLFNQ